MSWDELLDITPGMFLALQKQHGQDAKDRLFGFQFLATVVAQLAGNKNANFMPEHEGSRKGWEDDGVGLTSFLEARVIENGQTDPDPGQTTEGPSGGDERIAAQGVADGTDSPTPDQTA